ncbi:MAG TPA: hypothetical protein VHB99_06150 [Pirellulales bacterium]|nr:hypothetical protein [Pirellulales bacterium]
MRFRLKSLFILTFLVALACMVLFALPDPVSVFALAAVAMATPGGLIAGIIYGRGAKRAFAIGCFASGGWLMWVTPIVFYASINGAMNLGEEPTVAKIVFVSFYGVLAFGGLVSIGVRRLCYQGRNGIRPPRDCC